MKGKFRIVVGQLSLFLVLSVRALQVTIQNRSSPNFTHR